MDQKEPCDALMMEKVLERCFRLGMSLDHSRDQSRDQFRVLVGEREVYSARTLSHILAWLDGFSAALGKEKGWSHG